MGRFIVRLEVLIDAESSLALQKPTCLSFRTRCGIHKIRLGFEKSVFKD